jgi:membrane-associated phospholipid phosphatase
MTPWHIRETKLDRQVARVLALHANPAVERVSGVLTWAADEHLLYGLAAGVWLLSRCGDADERQQANQLAASVAATALLPHLIKRLVDQKRPDRCMVPAYRRGIPKSGRALDAFPSGHAMHIGAIASVVSRAAPKAAPLAWSVGALIASTRVVLLAHWVTDVLAGLALGACIERLLWSLNRKAPLSRESPNFLFATRPAPDEPSRPVARDCTAC